MLQSPTIDFAQAIDVVNAVRESVELYRDDCCFDGISSHVIATADSCNISSTQSVEKRIPRLKTPLEESVVMSTFGISVDLANKDEFKTHIFYSVIDNQLPHHEWSPYTESQ